MATHKPRGHWVRTGLKNGDFFGGTWRISYWEPPRSRAQQPSYRLWSLFIAKFQNGVTKRITRDSYNIGLCWSCKNSKFYIGIRLAVNIIRAGRSLYSTLEIVLGGIGPNFTGQYLVEGVKVIKCFQPRMLTPLMARVKHQLNGTLVSFAFLVFTKIAFEKNYFFRVIQLIRHSFVNHLLFEISVLYLQ